MGIARTNPEANRARGGENTGRGRRPGVTGTDPFRPFKASSDDLQTPSSTQLKTTKYLAVPDERIANKGPLFPFSGDGVSSGVRNIGLHRGLRVGASVSMATRPNPTPAPLGRETSDLQSVEASSRRLWLLCSQRCLGESVSS